jgi:hopene-associated glycosyltransferase HpnB
MAVACAVAAASLAAWGVLLFLRGGYWRVRPLLDVQPPPPRAEWPSVVAVIPARNEEAVLESVLPRVLSQDYPRPFGVTLVDDRSEDGTATLARAIASRLGLSERLSIVRGQPLASGWVGKVWAMAQGVSRAEASSADYLWFTDADVAYDAGVLRTLVDKAERERLDLVSLMVRLRVDTRWDCLLIPAFVYFFAKLYPFRFVNDVRRRAAGAAGGCMLVRREALERAGGLAEIRSALIDDCALARLIKRSEGRIWLGFTRSAASVRPYGTLASTWSMVSRSAYTQLKHSPLLVLGTVLGMLFLYAVGPAAFLGGIAASLVGLSRAWALCALGAAAWVMMGLSFVPMLRHHGTGWWPAPLLPVAGVLYTVMVVDSACRHATGRGGVWKGRTQGKAADRA